MNMISVRFPKEMHGAVRRFAKQDRMTVSAWLRKLIEAEMKQPYRAPPMDYTLWGPLPTTASSSCRVEWIQGPMTSGSVTGSWEVSA
jgi:hypothetical protein